MFIVVVEVIVSIPLGLIFHIMNVNFLHELCMNYLHLQLTSWNPIIIIIIIKGFSSTRGNEKCRI